MKTDHEEFRTISKTKETAKSIDIERNRQIVVNLIQGVAFVIGDDFNGFMEISNVLLSLLMRFDNF